MLLLMGHGSHGNFNSDLLLKGSLGYSAHPFPDGLRMPPSLSMVTTSIFSALGNPRQEDGSKFEPNLCYA